jgi:hypothetical protein
MLRNKKRLSLQSPGKILPFFMGVCHYIMKLLCFLWYWFQRFFLVIFLLFLTIGLAWWTSQKPSNLRDWTLAESILPTVSWSGNIAIVENVRNHDWITDKEFTPGYYDASYNLDEIERVDYLITPFSDHDGPAHTMLSFTFSGGQHVVIS